MKIKDKKEKQSILKDLLKQMSGRVAENDLKPKKTKMVIEAEGDSPEEIKDTVIEKLGTMKLPDAKDLEDMEEDMETPEEEEMEGDDDFLSELPEGLMKALKKKLKTEEE